MPAALADLIAHLDALLEPERFEDYCVNGLQVPGAEHISTVATGVSAHAELFELATAERADLLLVHHGLFWGDGERRIDPILRRRLKLLFDANIALAAYHLPLDAHLEVGNNALLAQAMGAIVTGPFALHRGVPIGVLAQLPASGLTFGELVDAAQAATGSATPPIAFDAGPARTTTVAVVTGAGADYLPDAAAAGAHTLVTGEATERTMAMSREQGVHLIAAGHYATETFGVRRLGELLAERFGLSHTFLDVPNPV